MGIKDKAIKAGKSALRGAYRKALGPQANMLQKGLDFVAPGSKASRAVSAIVDPKILGGKGAGPKTSSKTNPKKVKETAPKSTKTKVKANSAKGKVGKNRGANAGSDGEVQLTMRGEDIAPKRRRMPARMKGGGVAKKAAGGMMSPQPMPARSRPPMPPRPPKPRSRPKPRTELIDPRLPRGKVGKGPLEPRDSTTRVISQPPKKKMKFGERIRKDRGLPQMPPKGSIRATSKPAGSIPPLEQGPGMKDGGSVKAYKAGGAVNKRKATGAAKRGFGKAYMKGKR